MSQADASPDDGDESDVWITEQLARYRNVRDHIEREALPLATSVDGRRFECQASLHGLRLRRGGYVTLESDSGARLGQITELSSRTIEAAVATGEGGTTPTCWCGSRWAAARSSMPRSRSTTRTSGPRRRTRSAPGSTAPARSGRR